MKGVILAGGNGSRLYPNTKVTNKHLLPVYNRPMIYYPLQTLVDNGITEILIVAGKGFAGDFLELLGSGEELGISLSYTVQEKPAGIAHALGLCKKFVGEENVAVILGDNIFEDKEFNFDNFREGARIYLKSVPDPERFGVVKFNDRYEQPRKLVEIREKPQNWSGGSGLIVTGLYLYDFRVFDYINCLKPSNRGELEISDVNNMYIKDGLMDWKIINGFWSDAGTFDSLYNASEYVYQYEHKLKLR